MDFYDLVFMKLKERAGQLGTQSKSVQLKEKKVQDWVVRDLNSGIFRVIGRIEVEKERMRGKGKRNARFLKVLFKSSKNFVQFMEYLQKMSAVGFEETKVVMDVIKKVKMRGQKKFVK